MTLRVNKLDDLLFLGANKSIVSQKVTPLTLPGENYGSVMLRVDVTVETPNGTEQKHVVAKMVPPNTYVQEIFNTQVTFRNEIGFYKEIVPVLQNFQREQGATNVIDSIPKFYGSRINLTGDPNTVDADGVIILENLKYEGFQNLDKAKGFDLDGAKLVIENLAQLHAVPLALKIKKPEVFRKHVHKYFVPHATKLDISFVDKMMEIFGTIDDCKPYLNQMRAAIVEAFEGPTTPREPFATLSHNDCWVNNIMVKLQNGEARAVKFVDFQIFDYSSAAKDLIFFLLSSVQNHVIASHYDDLIELYFKTFISVLDQLKCDTSEFTFDAFLQELDYEAKHYEFGHIAFMLIPMFAGKDTVKEVSEISHEQFVKMAEAATDEFKEKLAFVVKQFVKRNWL